MRSPGGLCRSRPSTACQRPFEPCRVPLPPTCRALADLDLVIGVRLHILVSAAALGVPYIALCYEDKCWDFQESVGLAGFSQSLPDVDGDWLDERIRDLRGVGLPAEAEAKVDEFVARQQAAAHAALTELRL